MRLIQKILATFEVIRRLGIANVAYVMWYRVTLKTSIRRFLFPIRQFKLKDEFFPADNCTRQLQTNYPSACLANLKERSERLAGGNFLFFGCQYKSLGQSPDWFLNPFNEKVFPDGRTHWTKIQTLSPTLGDIKCVWETSRFGWAPDLARSYVGNKDLASLKRLNDWISNWMQCNPLNAGVNWVCGQEASIRIFHILLSWIVLGRGTVSLTMINFLEAHAKRIEGNLNYALAQDNNHATSEAAAIYLIGLVLGAVENKYSVNSSAKKWKRIGKQLLEKTISKLVLSDGSFSQSSVNYHRLFLDTINLVEYLRLVLEDEPFSEEFYSSMRAAALWLYQIVNLEVAMPLI